MGYERIFLASYSYGTRVAQVYLREAPEAIVGAVLNGIVPMDTPVYVEMGRNLDQTVAQILHDCRKNTQCNSEYPEVEVMLRDILDDLDRPIEVAVEFEDLAGTVEFTRQRFGYALRGLLYGRPLELPKTIADVHGGDWSGLAQLHAQRLRGIWANYAMAHHLSVLCREDIRRTTQADAESRNRSGIMGAELISGYHEACRQWPGGVLPEGESAAVTSDLPVLLLSGEYDPATPAAWAESVAVHFPNSLQVTIPGQGHFVGGECVSVLQAAFFKAASVDGLDVSCSKEVRPAFALRN